MKIEINETGKWQNSLTIKMVLLAVTGLFLLIPLQLIKEMILERQQNSEIIKDEISSQWSGKQLISGPVLNIPIIKYPSKKDAEPYKIVFHLMPEKLNIKSDISAETRHRGIYKTVVYSSPVNIDGIFLIPELSFSEKTDVLWQEAYFSIGISDNRGIKGSISLVANDKAFEAIPGVKDFDLYKTGITFPAFVDPVTKQISFSVLMQVAGSESLSFTPLGKETKVNMVSSWNSPGFTGNFLPVERNITNSGFKASWLVTNLNRNFPQSWIGDEYKTEQDSFGTAFILEADHYQKSVRSAKYGILFIALTFLALIFTEMTQKEKINIFHYLLMALGLVLFFSLLNALSEHTGFSIAYVVSAVSTIALIGSFLKALMKSSRPVLLTTGLLVFLYSFIFILLSLKDYAYLAGNLGLFILLAITMKLSLKLKDLS
ncbi:MAG TPA: cell envelope integrity protein CreD [Bacteroidales bacterium]|nr:cell envelope integrity protein CreD [Bacteroidales bacterium]